MPSFETIASILSRKGQEVWSLPPNAPVSDAMALMAQKGVAAVLVISDATPVGIVSAKDYGLKVALKGRSSRAIRLQEIMSSPVITIDPDADAAHALAMMTQHHIRHLPVIDEGKLIGVISMGDLARAIISDQAFAIEQLKGYIGQA